MRPCLSIIVPIYNEEDNIQILNEKINNTLNLLNLSYEIIYVDDNSSDKSLTILKEIKNERTKIIKFRKNFGQTQAMLAGINNSKGEILITLDADLQNSPKDIVQMLDKYNQGFDLVCGWRKKRRDKFIRTIPSKLANLLIAQITNIHLHDTGCTLKIYNGDIARKMNLFADHHRFIPAIFSQYTDKITEIEVSHNPRIYGKSKYNILRVFRVLIDLFAITYWKNYSNKPMYFWGNLAFLNISLSSIFLILIFITQKFLFLILFGIFLNSGIVFFAIGLAFENFIKQNLSKNKDQNYEIETIL